MKIEYAKNAVKYIESLDKPTKQRIKAGIEGLTGNPPKGDIKTLQGYSDGRKRLVIAWDPDFTKVTLKERIALEEAEKDIAENGTISHDAINWD